MKDIQTHLDKIRSDAAECVLLGSLVADGKGEVFARTAQHLYALASEVEKTVAINSADKGTSGESEPMARAGDGEEPVATDIASADHRPAAPPRRMLPWLLAIVVGGIVGALFWTNNPAKEYWSAYILTSKHETSPAPQDETKQAIATLLSGEQAARKILMEQLSGLAARVDNLVRAIDDLKTRAEIAGPSNKDSVGAEEKPPAAENKSPVPGEKPVRREENRIPALESPAAAKQSDGTPPATDGPLIEPVDRVGTIPPRRAELDPRKPTVGPAGCAQFRSFDPVSGTYTTLDGRRRQCRQ